MFNKLVEIRFGKHECFVLAGEPFFLQKKANEFVTIRTHWLDYEIYNCGSEKSESEIVNYFIKFFSFFWFFCHDLSSHSFHINCLIGANRTNGLATTTTNA